MGPAGFEPAIKRIQAQFHFGHDFALARRPGLNNVAVRSHSRLLKQQNRRPPGTDRPCPL